MTMTDHYSFPGIHSFQLGFQYAVFEYLFQMSFEYHSGSLEILQIILNRGLEFCRFVVVRGHSSGINYFPIQTDQI